MYRTEALNKVGGLDLKSGFAVDLDLAMRIAVHYDFYYIDQVLSSWRLMPSNETASSHVKGFNLMSFYYITRKILADPEAMKLFPEAERPKLIRDSIYFCSCRALLNLMAGLRGRSWAPSRTCSE